MVVETTCEVESTLASLTYLYLLKEHIPIRIYCSAYSDVICKERVFVFRYGLHISSFVYFRNDAIGVR